MDETKALQERLEVVESLVCQALDPALAGQAGAALYDPEADFAAAATYFLLGLDASGGVEQFVTHTLGRLLLQLIRSTEPRQVEYRGQVRGRILWPATYKLRYCDDYDPTCFVCREVHRRYDTPENQLLKYVMEGIGECLKIVPDVIRHGVCYRPGSPGRWGWSTARRLARMETALNRLWRNVYLREITVPPRITEQHLLRAQTARLEEYHQVAHIYRRYREVVLEPSWEGLVGTGTWVLPLPARTGGPGDRWIRLGAALWQAGRFAPRTGRRPRLWPAMSASDGLP
jgi:hypothetical protein